MYAIKVPTQLFKLQLLASLGPDYRRFNRHIGSFIKFMVLSILLLVPELTSPNVMKIHAQLKKWFAV